MNFKLAVKTTFLSLIILILAACITAQNEKTKSVVDSKEKVKEVVLIRNNYKLDKNWNLVDIPDNIVISKNNKDVQVFEEEYVCKEMKEDRNIVIGYNHNKM
ncbi:MULTISPECIES: hypothetical protein [Niallia]|uniref:Lipoprotein n=1 Tax=Niallia taxi TaxID=2499688 RepID=A0A437K764_9BACI|nr:MULTISPECIES: hypothetical protein [Niallia]MDK8643694.1 hypothetical protein [Niallia taxi]MED4038297.1 hypothetical protein [Niallia taxi]MED4057588.1 hypothetical protein [Niallia taxi]MED4120618.1 hypothetical protein [Niallia taxi]RVT59450.1 hypothetical protein EM808_19330 [Niallia taxi]